MADKISKTEAEWRAELGPEAFHIAREKGTEPAFTGVYWDCHDAGIYHCRACGQPLFDAGTKFNSGTGWPSFWAPIEAGRVALHEDTTHGMRRVEVVCSRCGSHLGHLFPDGPRPTGQRYCMNSAVLKLEPK